MSDPVALHQRRRNGLPTARTASGPLGKRILLNRWTWVFVVSALVFAGCLMFQYQLVTAPVKTDDGEVAGLGGLQPVHDVQHHFTVVDLDGVVLQVAAGFITAPHPQFCVVSSHSQPFRSGCSAS